MTKKKTVVWTEQDLRDMDRATQSLQKVLNILLEELNDFKKIKALKSQIKK